MSNIVLIPARGGSKGIKLKNITPLCGKPLIYWVLTACQNAQNIDKIVVATDSDKIEYAVKNLNFSKVQVYRRLPENAKDNSKTIDLILEYIPHLNPEDTLILAQATSPLTVAEDFDNALQEYYSSGCDSMISCVRAEGFYWTENGEPIFHDKNNRKRRQDYVSQVLKENGAFYIGKVSSIRESHSLMSGSVKPFIMSPEKEIDIDEPKDLICAEKVLLQRSLKNIDFKKLKMLLVDCDGTLTDGGMYYSKEGEILKKFNTKDGFGIKKIKDLGFIVGIITGENSDLVRKRAEKLNITELHMGIYDKLPEVETIAQKYNITLDEIVYVGDGLNDYEAVKNVGFGCATANAAEELKNVAKYTTKIPGGMGAVREVIDLIINNIRK